MYLGSEIKEFYTIFTHIEKPMKEHIPVLAPQVIELLNLQEKDIVVDGTFGLGGHTKLMIEEKPSIHVYGFDLDKDNSAIAIERLKDYTDNFTVINTNFAHLQQSLEERGVTQINKCLLDLGICSTHVDDAQKGFSFIKEGPLDMRFNQEEGLSAADVLNTYSEKDLMHIFFSLGEEPLSKKYARRIVEERSKKPFETTTEFASFIEGIGPKHLKKHPATRIFQALRIYVNIELESLEQGLTQACSMLAPQGRIAVISYHSLEDRIVKNHFATLAPKAKQNKYKEQELPQWTLVTRKPLAPEEDETKQNPRARSAKLRVIHKNF